MKFGRASVFAVKGIPFKNYWLCRIWFKYVLKHILIQYRTWRIVSSMKTLARDARQLGNLIRNARKQQAMSQKALGDRAGLRQETISLLESGNPAARVETVLSVLAALNLEMQVVPRSKGGYLPD